MHKVAVIGRRADILPFRAVGAELMEVQDDCNVQDAFRELCKYTEPVMVMITEDLLEFAGQELDLFRENHSNVLLPIPTINTEPGKRLQEIRALVARALGVDLLGKKE